MGEAKMNLSILAPRLILLGVLVAIMALQIIRVWAADMIRARRLRSHMLAADGSVLLEDKKAS
jgi:hypothetical protein